MWSRQRRGGGSFPSPAASSRYQKPIITCRKNEQGRCFTITSTVFSINYVEMRMPLLYAPQQGRCRLHFKPADATLRLANCNLSSVPLSCTPCFPSRSKRNTSHSTAPCAAIRNRPGRTTAASVTGPFSPVHGCLSMYAKFVDVCVKLCANFIVFVWDSMLYGAAVCCTVAYRTVPYRTAPISGLFRATPTAVHRNSTVQPAFYCAVLCFSMLCYPSLPFCSTVQPRTVLFRDAFCYPALLYTRHTVLCALWCALCYAVLFR